MYYPYGIRNSFGIDFDPVSRKLWATENGPRYGDELNFVELGFNCGWPKVMGIWKPLPNEVDPGPIDPNPYKGLVDFEGKGICRSPEFLWFNPISPIAVKFPNTDRLGKEYKNDLFVSDFNIGSVYRFDLN